MKQREIKFKCWLPSENFMGVPFDPFENDNDPPDQPKGVWRPDSVFLQYTGLKDKHGKEIYEGDVFRVEEQETEICDQCDGCGWHEGGPTLKTTCAACNGTGQIDEVERHYYLVIVWVKEWCMFCTLRVDDEYFNYLNEGIKALDEPMFWTYTLEDTADRKFFHCGNIYEHPHLLKQEKV